MSVKGGTFNTLNNRKTIIAPELRNRTESKP